MKPNLIKVGISLAAILLASGHLFASWLTLDPLTLGLIVLAVLPWLVPMLRSVELPGGLKIELRDFKALEKEAEKAGILDEDAQDAGPAPSQYSFLLVADSDPVLALAGLRIEIERKLIELSEAAGLEFRRASVGRLLNSLDRRELLPPDTSGFLRDILGLLNQAVHGAEVEPDAAAWVLDRGPKILRTLERQISATVAGRPADAASA